jgi:hypothetical protein
MAATQENQARAGVEEARKIALVADSFVVMEGAGVPVRRVLPSRTVPYRLVDPWLLLDHFRMDDMGSGESFPPHPHRGFEIITYMLQGTGNHQDSEGNQGTVRAGGLQRITTGRGIWHGEGGGGQDGPVDGLQLWINLAQAEKRIDPAYQPVQPEEIPERQIGDAKVRVLVGQGSPTKLHTPAVYYDVTLPPNGQTTIDVPAEFQGFVYVMDGGGTFGSNHAAAQATQIAALGEGGALTASAGAQGAHFVLAAGQPHREPVRFNGPYVD